MTAPRAPSLRPQSQNREITSLHLPTAAALWHKSAVRCGAAIRRRSVENRKLHEHPEPPPMTPTKHLGGQSPIPAHSELFSKDPLSFRRDRDGASPIEAAYPPLVKAVRA